MKIKSVFGGYTDQLQVVIDNSKSRFAPLWYPKYFGFAPAQNQLTFTQAIGASRIEAAASVVNRDSQTPLRSRPALEKMSGEIPAIKEAFKMKESDYRDFLSLQALNVDDATKRGQILDFIFNDTKKVGDSAHKRLDYMALEAISTGKVTLTTTNNPDGLVVAEVDLLMPSANKANGAITWATSSTATPLTDIETFVQKGQDVGVTFAKILMSRALWLKFKKCKEVIDSLVSYNQLQKGAAIATLDKVNEYLQANLLPIIEIVDETIGIEKDGVIGSVNPFNQDTAVFIPNGRLGVIKNAVAIEQLQPVANVTYATFNRALISKWSENEPFGEWTKVEFNAFPALEAIDQIFLLKGVF
ncbi:MAG TPA: major capsid protein [Agriterribacter sp.]|uniref:major capsid protein n=1 Tax=Agriterribacter sp. TaxID=2821509 RepID=UPI002BC2F407|nr:major capsid protein [Agriterribacter sp.]HRQ17707.1 major capsid protein [Agriterribacter sp.]